MYHVGYMQKRNKGLHCFKGQNNSSMCLLRNGVEKKMDIWT